MVMTEAPGIQRDSWNRKQGRVLFVGGCSRSGTTLLADQLGRATGYVVIPESQFKDSLLHLRLSDERIHRSAVRAMLRSWRLAVWDIDDRLTEQMFAEARSVEAIMNVLVAAYCSSNEADGRNWIDHTPTNIDVLPYLHREFPEGRFIHLIRDPRAVWASVRSLNWGPHSVFTFVHWWSRAIANGLSGEMTLANCIIRIRYEDFCRSPAVCTRRIIQQLGLEATAGNIAFNHPGFKLPSYTTHQHQLVGAAPRTEHINRWRDLLARREIEIIETELSSLMHDFGYTPISSTSMRATTTERLLHNLARAPIHVARQLARNLRIFALSRRRRFSKASSAREKLAR
jgi:hypothetical protein